VFPHTRLIALIADGDTSLTFFPRAVTPNHHALAERFGVFDRFFVNAEVSPDGHNWSLAAYTTDALATIERILHLGSLSQFDHFGRPISEPFGNAPDLRPYRTSRPAVDLEERNPSSGRDARESAHLDLRFEDLADDESFNRILWRMMKGDARPYPPARRMSTLEFTRAR
jgi:hypothetical protein